MLEFCFGTFRGTFSGELNICLKRSSWCARKENEVICSIAKRTLAYVAIIFAAVADILLGTLKGLAYFSICWVAKEYERNACTQVRRIFQGIAMPLLGLGAFFNSLPDVYFGDDPYEPLLSLKNQLLDPSSSASQMEIGELRQQLGLHSRDPLEEDLTYWVIDNDFLDLMERLLSKGLCSSLSLNGKRSLLFSAIKDFKPKVVEFLVRKGVCAEYDPGKYLSELLFKLKQYGYHPRAAFSRKVSEIARCLIFAGHEISHDQNFIGWFGDREFIKDISYQQRLSTTCREEDVPEDVSYERMRSDIDACSKEYQKKKKEATQQALDPLPTDLQKMVLSYL